ncbi:protein transport protein sec23-1 [Phalaenopsis equestris]|uniref:protein transport protein sec23-1 n=1 Tax=Phalaenopsis equestris TaxID=78828 RepID=UPI0009E1EDF4|nr:protein transport protein sec23-1 [Phalaenopsis equestris]XP_020590493.1 protein transport protein sec23-1 [Phalaenopsis equestris]XP_020590494.1 protein transport protein sec23-1 [Phalaenopsis equestris]
MDFTELEAVEGLRWPWNAWPSSRSDAASLVVPLSVICTPLMPLTDLPLLPYEPLSCSGCSAVLNPYARVDYRSALWICSFCHRKNPFPRSYAGIADHNLPAELFPTHSTVEYLLPYKNTNPSGFLHNSFSSSPSFASLTSSISSASVTIPSPAVAQAPGPAFVFVVDVCSAEEELRALKNEILHVVANLPENAMVGLVSFGSMVWVHDLGYAECSRVMLFCGDRELSSMKIQELLGACHFLSQQPIASHSLQKQGFLRPVSECEFNFSTAIEELHNMSDTIPEHHPLRATGAAISTSIALLEGYSPTSGGRVMVFTSGMATIGPGMVAEIDHSKAIRTQRDIVNGNTSLYVKACNFYQKLSQRLLDKSLVLDLFACSLDQVGAAEMRFPIETSGGLLILTESFESEQFKRCLRQIFKHVGFDHFDMNFDATINLVTTNGVKICGALGPCMSLKTKNRLVSEKEIGQGGTSSWKMSTLTNKTSLAFIFQVGDNQPNNEPGPVFFVQFKTRYRHGNGSIRLRVTTAARRWASGARHLDINAGFDQEAAATIMARLAVSRAEDYHARDVIRWLDKMLIRFTAKFGDYVPEDPSSFRLPSGFSLYPQFMYYLRRSQFIDIFNYTPDETAFFRLALNMQGVTGTLIMIQPTLLPMPVLLDISSVSPDVILLFDSYFHVVIHYGSKIAQWRKKLGFDNDQSHETLRKLLEVVEMDAEELIEGRIPVPKLIKCDQHSSQARFLLAKLNPSVTQKTRLADGSEVIFTDDVSLQAFLEHLQSLAVQG